MCKNPFNNIIWIDSLTAKLDFTFQQLYGSNCTCMYYGIMSIISSITVYSIVIYFTNVPNCFFKYSRFKVQKFELLTYFFYNYKFYNIIYG